MSELRGQLRREEERFRLPPDALDRFHRRRLTRQRNRRITSGALALLVAAGGSWVAFSALRGGEPGSRPLAAAEVAVVPARPTDIAAGEGRVWVVSASQDLVFSIDPGSGEVSEIALPAGLGPPAAIRVADGSVWVQTAFVAPDVAPTVVRLEADPAGATFLAGIRLDRGEHVRVAIGDEVLWSANPETGLVSARDLGNGRVTITVQGPPPLAEVELGEGALWLLERGRASSQEDILERIDPETGESTGSVGIGPSSSMAVGSEGIWLVRADGTAVLRVDPGTLSISDVIPVRGHAAAITAGPAGVWVLDAEGGRAVRVDVPESIRIEGDPIAIAQGEGAVWAATADGAVFRIT